jgi:MFS_1 like family
VWGAGSVIGSVIFARAAANALSVLLAAGTLAVGLAYVGFAAAPSIWVAFPAALLGGTGNGVQWASLISAVQRLTPPALHGRLMGAVESLGSLCPGIGLALGGGLVALSSPRGAFLAVGLGAVATTASFIGLLRYGLDLDAEPQRAKRVIGDGGLRAGGRPARPPVSATRRVRR